MRGYVSAGFFLAVSFFFIILPLYTFFIEDKIVAYAADFVYTNRAMYLYEFETDSICSAQTRYALMSYFRVFKLCNVAEYVS